MWRPGTGQLLSDVMVIADEVDEQLMTAVHTILELEAKPTVGVVLSAGRRESRSVGSSILMKDYRIAMKTVP
jgi:hypothetical protein